MALRDLDRFVQDGYSAWRSIGNYFVAPSSMLRRFLHLSLWIRVHADLRLLHARTSSPATDAPAHPQGEACVRVVDLCGRRRIASRGGGDHFPWLSFRRTAAPFSGNTTVIITALGFSLVHFQLLYFVPLAGTGLILGWARLKTDSLRFPVFLHLLNNGLFLILAS
jgi:hypothetical protein